MPKFPFTNYHELNLDWILKKVTALFDASEENAQTIRTYNTRLTSAEQTATSAATAATAAQQLADAASENADSALSVAGTANTKADSALTAATNAAAAVENTLTIAQAAQQTAASAVATANDAAATASSLESLANTANQNATAALETAQTADQKATAAQSAAATADQKAVAAQSAATTNAGNISTLQTDVSNLNRQISELDNTIDAVSDKVDSLGFIKLSECQTGIGWISNANVWNNVTNAWQHVLIPVKGGDKISFITGNVAGYYAFLKTYVTPVSGATPDFSSVAGYTGKTVTYGKILYNVIAPDDANFLILPLMFDNTINDYAYILINGYNIIENAFDNFSDVVKSSIPVWYAFGDSITQGYTSINGAISSVTAFNYVYYVSMYNNYFPVNYAEGGAGYNHKATVGELKTAKEKIDGIDFSGCDLVTLAYGVNDWHYGVDIGTIDDSTSLGTTMASNMKYCIEKILTDNPLCKIIVLLPMNNSAFGTGNNKENNWGLGATVANSGTLQHVIDVEKSICKYYGIEYIDQSKTGLVNRENIQDILSDGTHPIESAYKIIGANLARQIHFA